MRLRHNIFKWNLFSKMGLFPSQKYLATACLPLKNKKKTYLGGYSISLISRPDVYALRSSSLLGEGRGVPNDGPAIFPVLSGGSRCRCARPQPGPASPWVILHINCPPGRANGELDPGRAAT